MTEAGPDAEADEAAARVLVVSADADAGGFLAALLGREGFDAVAEALDSAAAAVVGADPPFELVVVDTDPQAARSIRLLADADKARIPIAVLGAPDGADDEAEAAATTAGADTWIARPVDDHELLAALRRALA